MPGFNTLPAVGGGGGQANMTFVASIHMNTYNRSWAQGGTAGYYAMYSTNQENGYVYFVGATTTGGPLNRLINVNHAFTRIDVIAPTNDMLSLYKGKVKATTEFPNPFAAFSSFPSIITASGNFVLPNNALPLVNVLVQGAGGTGGHGNHSHGGGGGGGGNVIKLTAFQAVGTTSVSIGAGSTNENQAKGGDTYFGNVYALGGGGGGHGGGHSGGTGGNGGGAGGGGGQNGGSGTIQSTVTGLGNSGTPVFHGGHSGGHNPGGSSHHHRGGGGGGAGGAGQNGASGSGGQGGAGHTSDIDGSSKTFGSGGRGAQYDNSGGHSTFNYGHGGNGGQESNSGRGNGANGAVIVRYYIP